MRAYVANVSVCPKLIWMNNTRIRLTFKGNCLKQDDTSPFTPNNFKNLFIVYELHRWSRDLNTDFSLKDCLFGIAKVTKNADPGKHKHSHQGIGFDSHSRFLFTDECYRKHVINFGVDMRLSGHVDNEEKDILIFGERAT